MWARRPIPGTRPAEIRATPSGIFGRGLSYPGDRIAGVFTTELFRVPLIPEISLHLAGAGVGLFDSSGGEFRGDEPPPFWAFVWAGGQALARYVLDHPELVRGRRVLDLGAGSGVVAIAAARAGAASVTAADFDPAAARAIRRNAAANGVSVTVTVAADAGPPAGTNGAAHADDASRAGDATRRYDVVLAGDAFYAPSVARRMTTLLRERAAHGARVLVGDPGRGYFPERLFRLSAEYEVPVPAVLEETDVLLTGVYEMRTTSGRR